jgi:DNA-directed RNA polymerase subunit alpha
MTILKENWKELIKPSSISVNYKDTEKKIAEIIIEPLERGYGLTLGNALRRVLLSSIRGFAVTSVKIDGVLHEFSFIKGVKEDVVDIIMNIKSLVIMKDSSNSSTIRLSADKKGIVTAGDIITGVGVEILNKDLIICTIEDDSAKLNLEMIVESGSGYKPAQMQTKDEQTLGAIAIDAVFSPVKKVTYKVQSARVGHKTDYDKLILEVHTDGTITSEEAIGLAAKIIQNQLEVFINFTVEEEKAVEIQQSEDKVNLNLVKKIDEMELSVRSYNCLKNEGIIYVGDLVSKTEGDMLKLQNFGRKSLTELKDNLKTMNLSFGMKLEKWPLDNVEELSKKRSKMF